MDNMMKFAIRNYIHSFRWSHIKECIRNGNLYAYTFLTFGFLVLPSSKTENFLAETLLLLPTIFIFLSSAIFTTTLPKLMYLCPLSQEMRKDYIEKARFVKIAVPIILTAAILSYLYLSGQIHWLITLIILLNNVLFSVFMGTVNNVNCLDIQQDLYNKYQPKAPCAAFLEVLIVIFGFGISWLYSNYYYNYQSADTMSLFMLSAILLIPLPATIFYVKHWPYMLKQWLSYETSSYYPTTQKTGRIF